jgi:hypothetical protein
MNRRGEECRTWMPNFLRAALTWAAAASLSVVSASAEPTQELSETEMAAFRNQVAQCWNIPVEAVGAKAERVSVRVELDPSGAVRGEPQVLSDPSNSRLAQSAIHAMKRCSPFSLPAEKFGAWKELTITFDPSEMF